MLSSLSPSYRFPFGWFKELPYCVKKFLARPPNQFELQTFDDELCSPTTISPLQVGPPTDTRRELAPGHSPLIFDREALRADAL